MASVLVYKCNNVECSFQTKRELNFPVWTSESPKEMRKLPVGMRNRDLVAGYIDRNYCTVCRALQPFLKGSDICLICNNEGLFITDETPCPNCKIGLVLNQDNSGIIF